MSPKKFGLLLAVIIVVVLFLVYSVYLRSIPIRFNSYNSMLGKELDAVNSYNGNFTFYYSGNFISNQPLSTFFIREPFSIPFNYTFFRNGKNDSTAFNVQYNMNKFFALQNLENNATVINSIEEYADNGSKVEYNLSRLSYIENKYSSYVPISKIAFTNASGLYICSAYPSVNDVASLGVFSCGFVSNSTAEGLKYMIYNLSQVTVYAIGFDVNELNLTMHYVGNSEFLNQTCAKYNLSSVIKSYFASSIYTNYSAYVNGTECISTKLYLPLYQRINVTIPAKKVYSFFNLTLVNVSDTVSGSITSFPQNHALNLTYGSI